MNEESVQHERGPRKTRSVMGNIRCNSGETMENQISAPRRNDEEGVLDLRVNQRSEVRISHSNSGVCRKWAVRSISEHSFVPTSKGTDPIVTLPLSLRADDLWKSVYLIQRGSLVDNTSDQLPVPSSPIKTRFLRGHNGIHAKLYPNLETHWFHQILPLLNQSCSTYSETLLTKIVADSDVSRPNQEESKALLDNLQLNTSSNLQTGRDRQVNADRRTSFSMNQRQIKFTAAYLASSHVEDKDDALQENVHLTEAENKLSELYRSQSEKEGNVNGVLNHVSFDPSFLCDLRLWNSADRAELGIRILLHTIRRIWNFCSFDSLISSTRTPFFYMHSGRDRQVNADRRTSFSMNQRQIKFTAAYLASSHVEDKDDALQENVHLTEAENKLSELYRSQSEKEGNVNGVLNHVSFDPSFLCDLRLWNSADRAELGIRILLHTIRRIWNFCSFDSLISSTRTVGE
ncbi:hypothetical protein AHF37_06577 [Paragonimus kellicotti]|nr:hypothetical protein AHF37_06577 [Paragonimus kellicotti]